MIIFSDEEDCEDAVDDVMKGYNLELYEVGADALIISDPDISGGEHDGDGGGVRVRLHEEPQADQCPQPLQQAAGRG